jgi:hypothetical protein
VTARRRVDQEWRLFEALVARVERDALGDGTMVTSPDRLRCRLTGRLREVDASLVRPDGRITTIECRKRKGRQDVTWIEQLATKRTSLGADKTIAVSSKGFSQAAQIVAEQHNIELKVLRPLDGNVCPPADLDLVVFWHATATLHSAGLRFASDKRWAVPRPDEVDLMLPKTVDPYAPIFRNIDQGHRWSLNDAWRQLQEVTDPFRGIGKGEPPVVRTACFPYPGNVAVDAGDGEKRLGDLILSVALSIEPEPVWQSEADKVAYGPPGKPGLQRVEFASSQSKQDWHIALQTSVDADTARAVKTSSSWPDQKVTRDLR